MVPSRTDLSAAPPFIDHMERWASSFDAPVRESVTVTRLSAGGPRRFRIDTSAGAHDADVVVVATSTYQTPRVPALAPQLPDHLLQVTADAYRHPEALPAGGVLVVGSGQTGCQIAEELNEVGRHTYLCVGKAGRLPRRYRGRRLPVLAGQNWHPRPLPRHAQECGATLSRRPASQRQGGRPDTQPARLPAQRHHTARQPGERKLGRQSNSPPICAPT